MWLKQKLELLSYVTEKGRRCATSSMLDPGVWPQDVSVFLVPSSSPLQ